MNLTELSVMVHTLAIEKGWYEGDSINIPEKLALIHAEVSEALECYRDDQMETWSTASEKPEGFPIEIADIVIRVLDLCGALGIDIQGAVDQKHAYNATRPHRHGNKKC